MSDSTATRTQPCLRCRAPLDAAGATARCPCCGYLTVAADRRIYWTREPWLVWIEHALKALIVGATGAAFLAILSLPHGGTGSGWAIALPIPFAVALWSTASKVTRHVRGFAARTFWTWLFLLCGALPLFLVAIPWITVGIGLPEGRGPSFFAESALFSVPFLLLAWGVRHLADRLERWKKRRIAGAGAPGVD